MVGEEPVQELNAGSLTTGLQLAPGLDVRRRFVDALTRPHAAQDDTHWAVGIALERSKEHVDQRINRSVRFIRSSDHRHGYEPSSVSVNHESELPGVGVCCFDGPKNVDRILDAEQVSGQDI